MKRLVALVAAFLVASWLLMSWAASVGIQSVKPPPVPETQWTLKPSIGITDAGSVASAQLLAAVGPPPMVTNQIDWQFPPIDPFTVANLTNGFTAFIEVSTNNGTTWQRIAAAPYPPAGGVLHSAYASPRLTFIRTRAGYYLNKPTK